LSRGARKNEGRNAGNDSWTAQRLCWRSARSPRFHSKDIARDADIPVTSAYHFYPDKHRLLTALAVRYGEAFERIVVKPLPAAQIGAGRT
jgi:hypothetical protein